MADPGPLEDQSTATGFQYSGEGTDVAELLALAGSALQPGDIGTAAAEDVGYFATAAQGERADSAIQPPAVSTIAIDAGAIATPLDGSAYRLVLSEGVDAGWAAPLPTDADASTQVYWASLDILPPTSGGPFALSIPGDWIQTGPLDTIALEAGDDPITVVLRTWGASGIAYSAGWATL